MVKIPLDRRGLRGAIFAALLGGMVSACTTAEQTPAATAPAATPSLAGTSWRLVHFQSSDDAIGTVIPPNVERYTMKFHADGSLALGLDCNRGTGRWAVPQTTQTGGSITFSPGAMTRAMCAPGAIDSQIARDLAKVRSFTFDGDRLSLALEADTGFYVWERWSGH